MRCINFKTYLLTNSLYLANDTAWRHSKYGSQIGTRMRSIKWCHFLERTLTSFSRSLHSLTLNISQTAPAMAIVTIEGE